MNSIAQLLTLVDDYCGATGMAEATVSSRVFFDGKRLGEIRKGSDVGVRRLQRAVTWFSANWPDGVEWPAEIQRPIPEAAE